jgi:DNA repair photolyase
MEIEKKIVSPNKKFKSLVYREKAGRRSPWTCNFFIGCSNGCTYCCCSYIPKHNWDTKVKLIKHFENEAPLETRTSTLKRWITFSKAS